MNIGPKMAFILRVYQMTDAENAQDEEHDLEMVKAGLMSERERWKRIHTRSEARKIRQRDDAGNWPRDVSRRPYRYRRLRDGKVGRWGEVTKDGRKDDSYVRVGDEALLHQGQTKH
jgi:hypothetical protein